VDRRRAESGTARGIALSAFVLAAALALGCGATTRHRVLSFFFDGVPQPQAPAAAAAPTQPAAAAQQSRIGRVEHEPFAAKECDSCHDKGSSNGLVVSREKLCFQCHDFDLKAKYVHGPLVAGGCLLCHDPHSSPYKHLLRSDSDGFCLSCHDQRDLTKVDGHQAGRVDCTSCHEASMSDKKYLLK